MLNEGLRNVCFPLNSGRSDSGNDRLKAAAAQIKVFVSSL